MQNILLCIGNYKKIVNNQIGYNEIDNQFKSKIQPLLHLNRIQYKKMGCTSGKTSNPNKNLTTNPNPSPLNNGNLGYQESPHVQNNNEQVNHNAIQSPKSNLNGIQSPNSNINSPNKFEESKLKSPYSSQYKPNKNDLIDTMEDEVINQQKSMNFDLGIKFNMQVEVE